MLHWALTEEGWKVNHKRVLRLYREEGLRLRRKRRKRVATAPRERRQAPTRAGELWAMDFMSDELVDGRALRWLTIVDACTRECLALEPARSFPAERVEDMLEGLVERGRATEAIVMDNGPEFQSKRLHAWAYRRGVELHFITPGRPVENAFVESFNGTVRDDFLNQHLFEDEDDARRKARRWRWIYNHERPHSSLGKLPPAEFARRLRDERKPPEGS
jgi:putative transposase